MREADGFRFQNLIAKLALKGTPYEDLESMFTGPTAIGTSDDGSAAKTLVEFAKGNDKLAIIGGSMGERPLIRPLKHLPNAIP